MVKKILNKDKICPSCKSTDLRGLQVSFVWFEDNKIDLDSFIEEKFNARYFNSLSCNNCDSDIFDKPSSYFLDTNKICDQYEADEQIALLKESLKKRDWSGEMLYLIVNKGFIVFSDTGLEDLSKISKRLLSKKDFNAATYYTGGKIKQDQIYKIKELNEDMMLQHTE